MPSGDEFGEDVAPVEDVPLDCLAIPLYEVSEALPSGASIP